MTAEQAKQNQEFSDTFDLLYNNITSNQAPGLDEYEKSVCLTQGQDEILKSYFDPKLNKPQEGFDGSQRRQIDFSNVLRMVQPTVIDTNTATSKSIFNIHHGNNTKFYTMPDDVLMYINEILQVQRSHTESSPAPKSVMETMNLVVIPMDYNEFDRLMQKPFRRPLKRQAWRLIEGSTSQRVVELIPGASDIIVSYTVRYVKRPNPIILEDLTGEGVSIEGNTEAMACELDPILHHEIIQRAVELAKAAYTGGLQDSISLGQVSGTPMGIIASNNKQ